MTWEVRAERVEGSASVTLRKGYQTRDAAEGHRVTMKYWHRVWVQKTPSPASNAARSTEAWPEEKLTRLLQLYELGMSTTDIGHRMGVSKNAVIGKLHRMGWVRRA